MEGWDSADGITTRCGLNGRGIASRWAPDFLHSSRPAPGPTLPPVRRDISDSGRTKSYGKRDGSGKNVLLQECFGVPLPVAVPLLLCAESYLVLQVFVVCLIHRVLTASVRRVQGALPGK
jgi:hypothetical protein